MRAERVAKMRGDVQRERDAIAALRAEWATLENPARIQGLARRHLHLRPAEATQYDALDQLPERPPQVVPAAAGRRDRRTRSKTCNPLTGSRAGADGAAMSAIGRSCRWIDELPPAAACRRRRAGQAARGRLLRTLLYGRNVDRTAKARARVGLAILAFAAVYAAIAARLVMFAVAPESHFARRGASQRRGRDRAARHPRPQRHDPRDRRARAVAVCRAAQDHRCRRDRPNCSPPCCPISMPPRSATGWPRGAASSGSSAKSRRSSSGEIYKLGLPGVGFLAENKRVYPNSAEVSHLIGHVNIDNQGIAGMEKWLDGHGLQALHLAGLATDRLQKPVELAVDLRVQHALRDELIFAAEKFKVKAAAGLVVDVNTGEIISMVSLPDYDPNSPKQANDPMRINRLTTGVYELGSTFKALTLAMAFDSGKVKLNSTFDAHGPMHYGRFIIHDDHAQNRVLTVPEIFTYSSNIGAAQDRAVDGRRVPQVVPQEDGPARPAAHRIAGERRAAVAQALGRAQHRDHRVRPRHRGRAAAGG